MSNSSAMLNTQILPTQATFAQLLQHYLQDSQISCRQLAKELSLRPETLQRWLSGEVQRPRQRRDVLRCATYLSLTQVECNDLLTAAGFAPEPLLSTHSVLSSSKTRVVTTMPVLPPTTSGLPIHLVDGIHRSPFVIGPPITEPRQFFGRDYILKRIFDVWKYVPLQHIAIVGPKRSGKTSLLHYLRKIIDTPIEKLRPQQRNDWLTVGYQWVFIDFQDPRMCQPESLLRHILVELDLPVPEPCGLSEFMEIVDRYLEIPTLILLDEITAGLSSPYLDEAFWWVLRVLGSNHAQGKIGFVLTTHQPPEEIMVNDNKPSPFLNIFGHVLNLGKFTEAEARALIHSSPIPFAAEDEAWILEHSKAWPALVQILCHSCLTALEEQTPREHWRKQALRRMLPYQYLLDYDEE